MSDEISQALADARALCKASKVPFNPKLPAKFDDTPNEQRPASHRRWWHRPFIVSVSVEDMDAFYARRSDEYAEKGRASWALRRQEWLAAWPSGVRYEVRCLDGGAWDRSTNWGMFNTIGEAVTVAVGGRVRLATGARCGCCGEPKPYGICPMCDT